MYMHGKLRALHTEWTILILFLPVLEGSCQSLTEQHPDPWTTHYVGSVEEQQAEEILLCKEKQTE